MYAADKIREKIRNLSRLFKKDDTATEYINEIGDRYLQEMGFHYIGQFSGGTFVCWSKSSTRPTPIRTSTFTREKGNTRDSETY